LLGHRDDSGLDRVAVDVPQERQEMSIAIDQKGHIPPLEEMTCAASPAVEPLRVRALQRQHQARDRHRTSSDCQMDVVAHEAIGEQLELEALAVVRKPLQVFFAIAVVEKDALTLVATHYDVVQAPWHFHPQSSSHFSR